MTRFGIGKKNEKLLMIRGDFNRIVFLMCPHFAGPPELLS